MKDGEVTGKSLSNAMALAELIGAPEGTQYRWSCYNGVELYWFDTEGGHMRIVTYVDSFAYTKNPAGLQGNWQKVDYYFLYL